MATENDPDSVRRLEEISERWETATDPEKLLLAEELRGIAAGGRIGPAERAKATHLATTIEAQLSPPGP